MVTPLDDALAKINRNNSLTPRSFNLAGGKTSNALNKVLGTSPQSNVDIGQALAQYKPPGQKKGSSGFRHFR